MWRMIAISIIAGILLLIGLAGVVLPILPGVPLSWLGLFIFAYATKFTAVPFTAVMVFLGLTIASVALDFILPILGAKHYKASKYGIGGAVIGLLIGPLLFNFAGIIIGPLLGAILGEWYYHRNSQALRSGFGVFIGFMAAMLLKLALVLVMIGYFVVGLV